MFMLYTLFRKPDSNFLQNAYLHHVFDTSNAKTDSGPVKDLVDHDMPCAVCMAPNTAATIVIPGET